MARVVLLIVMLGLALPGLGVTGAAAQSQQAWVQVEAYPSLAEAEARARVYGSLFTNVNGFALQSGWYAIALGPFAPDEAQRQLELLRGERLIPGDSYIAEAGRFRGQFWPVGAALSDPGSTTTPDPAAQPAAPLPLLNLPEETLREARAGEALLGTEDRMRLQTALAWFGHYNAAIDGAFGPGTRRSMAEWQAAVGVDPTGVLTTAQRARLAETYQEDLASLGMEAYRDARAGIEVQIPGAMVQFDHYEPPFVHFAEKDGSGVRVLLISQSGDQGTLFGLYDIMQTLEIVPLEGPRERGSASFTLEGANAKVQSYTQAALQDGMIKGFTLVWNPADGDRMDKVLAAMKSSFTVNPDRVLEDMVNPPSAEDRAGLLSGLEVRTPVISRTGFYFDASGQVLTTAEVVQGCERITLDGEVETDVTLLDNALGLAVLTPRAPLSPAAFGAFRNAQPRQNAEVAVAGYSYEGVLEAPVMTYGSFAEGKGLHGEDYLARLALAALPGDAGAPVFDATGSVLGMLVPSQSADGKVLPENVGFALDAAAIEAALAAQGMTLTQAEEAVTMAPEDIARQALGMTVLVSCWN